LFHSNFALRTNFLAMPPALKRSAASHIVDDSGAKRAKKARVEGQYAQFSGRSIPEPKLHRSRTSGTRTLKAISWNVAGLRTFLQKRGADLKSVIKHEKPTVLGFLEHKLQAGKQLDEAVATLKSLLPEYEVHPSAFSCSLAKKGYSGVALIWRKDARPQPLVTKKQLENGSTEGRTLCMEFPTCYLVLTYVPNSGDKLQRLKERINHWDPRLRQYLQRLARHKPVVLLGDLNVAHRDVDIWNLESPHVAKSASTTPEERASFAKLLAAGFVDGFAHVHPNAKGAFTYWSIRAGNRKPNRGLRLDYIVVSEALASGRGRVKLFDAFHLPSYAPAGDHCPVGVSLQIS